MNNESDLNRMKHEYSRRKKRELKGTKYSPYNPSFQFFLYQRQREIVKILARHQVEKSQEYEILEVGCGKGRVLQEFLSLNFDHKSIFGIDILFDSLLSGKKDFPIHQMINTDAQFLPFLSNKFDLVMQFTAFSSILDHSIKVNMANEMLRVVKPEGAILWYDFWWNPSNKQTRGIKPKEIRQLFPDCSFEFHKITLAPPITRFVVPVSWMAGIFLESLNLFNTHYLVYIQKQ